MPRSFLLLSLLCVGSLSIACPQGGGGSGDNACSDTGCKLSSAAPGRSDTFGFTVAVEGDIAVVGAASETDAGLSAGAVSLFRLEDGQWEPEQILTQALGLAFDLFGSSVAISGDVIVAGAPFDDEPAVNPMDPDIFDIGSVSIFRNDGTTFVEEQRINAADFAQFDFFGTAVAVEGNVLVVGSFRDDDLGSSSGSVYVYRYNGMTWDVEQKLNASDGIGNDLFGEFVAISGGVIVVSSRGHDQVGVLNSGGAYAFRHNGATWVEEQTLVASDATPNDQFGSAVAIDGDVIIIGAESQNIDNLNQDLGAAYIYRYNGVTWDQEQKLRAADTSNFDLFGTSVAVDGDVIVVGAHSDDDDGSRSGSAYEYRYDGGAWTESRKFTAPDADTGDFFGSSVAMDEAHVIVGAFAETDEEINQGAAYVFEF